MKRIPRKDVDFIEWVTLYSSYVSAHAAELGLTNEQKTQLITEVGLFNSSLSEQYDARRQLKSTTQKKRKLRLSVEKVVRKFNGIIQKNPEVTNAQKASLGITIPKETRTPSPVPATSPIGRVDNVNRLEHIIHFFDEKGEGKKAKPAGVRGCEIWFKIGSEPSDISELKYLVMVQRKMEIRLK